MANFPRLRILGALLPARDGWTIQCIKTYNGFGNYVKIRNTQGIVVDRALTVSSARKMVARLKERNV